MPCNIKDTLIAISNYKEEKNYKKITASNYQKKPTAK